MIALCCTMTYLIIKYISLMEFKPVYHGDASTLLRMSVGPIMLIVGAVEYLLLVYIRK